MPEFTGNKATTNPGVIVGIFLHSCENKTDGITRSALLPH